jgi:agmatinase
MPEKIPLQSMPDYNLFGLEGMTYESSKVAVLPIPYDSTVTYKAGTREGPQAIINASRNIELYSCELGADVSKVGIYTLPSIAPDLSSPESMVARIKKEVGMLLDDGKVPLLLGGEHTITIGALQALKEKGRDISVICFDAHSDTRDEMYGTKYMHATAMARAKELYPDTFQIGLRSVDEDHAHTLDKRKVFFMEDIRSMGIDAMVSRILESSKKDVYLSIDLDVLDPSEMPSVGTPEPDGLRFSEMLSIMKQIGKEKNLLGLDFNELCPIPYQHAPDFLAAKLIYLTLGCFLLAK